MEEKVTAVVSALPVGHRRRQVANTDVSSGTRIPDACFCLVFYCFVLFFCRIKEKTNLHNKITARQEFVHCSCETLAVEAQQKLSLKPSAPFSKKKKEGCTVEQYVFRKECEGFSC